MSTSASPDRAGTEEHCCVCGRRDPRCLCKACRLRHTEGGMLAPWVASLQREAKRLTMRQRRARWDGVVVEALGDDW